MAEDEEEQDMSNYNIIGGIIVFSFISVIFVLVAALIAGSLNNYGLHELYQIVVQYAGDGTIPANFATIAESTTSSYSGILQYLDYIWFGAFLSFSAGSLVYSYFRRREGYFSMFAFIVLGLTITVYVGGIFIQYSEWIRDDLLFKVFPGIAAEMPLFTWYLNNAGVVNLILLCLVIILNFVNLDLGNFVKKKEEGTNTDEI